MYRSNRTLQVGAAPFCADPYAIGCKTSMYMYLTLQVGAALLASIGFGLTLVNVEALRDVTVARGMPLAIRTACHVEQEALDAKGHNTMQPFRVRSSVHACA
jgi:hypothetical protein